MKKIKGLFKYAYKYKVRYLIGVIFLIVVDLAHLITPKLIGIITDSLQEQTATPKFIGKYIFYIVLAAAFTAAGRFVWRIFIIGTSRKVEYDLRNDFFGHLQTLPTSFYNNNKTGDLMALATNDLNAVRMTLGPGIIMITDAIFLSIATIIAMLTINYKLTLLSLIPLPFITLTASKFGKKIHKKYTKVQEAFSKLTDLVQENFSGIRIIKSFVQEDKEFIKFTEENMYNFDTNMGFVKIWGLLSPLIEFIASLGFVILIGAGGLLLIYGELSLGEFISFNMYLGQLIWPMMAIGWVINIIQRGFASMERIENILKQKTDIYDENTENTNNLKGDLVVNDLTFSYPKTKTNALSNINLHIKEGQTLGIIGKTGSGKSTLVNLLVRLYNVPDSKISFGGIDINKISLKTLRENIGFVSQDSFLFSTTIAQNINLAKDNLDMEEVHEAAKNSDIYDNIIDFKEGFETMVGERGVTLSGGQKQRVAISRALIKNPDILIFDDCLSAVDAKTEVKILNNLKRIMKDKTSIIISHRISAIKDSDNIAVFDESKIIEYGTHEELLKSKGLYYDIYEKQLLEEKIQEEGEV